MKLPVEYVRIVLTERCNLSCAYCHKEGLNRAPDEVVSLDRFRMVIEGMYRCGIKKVKFMGGEPTCYPQLSELIECVRAVGQDIDISIISNGIFRPELIDELHEKGMNRINISIHSWGDKSSMQLTGMSEQDVELLKSNVIELKNRNLLTKVNYVVEKGMDYQELFQVLEWADENQVVVDVLNYLSAEGEKSDLYMSFDEIENIIKGKVKVVNELLIENKYSLPSKRLIMENGGQINLKIVQLNKVHPYGMCNVCLKKTSCLEGINAIRFIPNDTIRPCLFLEDNILNLNDCSTIDGLYEKIRLYLTRL